MLGSEIVRSDRAADIRMPDIHCPQRELRKRGIRDRQVGARTRLFISPPLTQTGLGWDPLPGNGDASEPIFGVGVPQHRAGRRASARKGGRHGWLIVLKFRSSSCSNSFFFRTPKASLHLAPLLRGCRLIGCAGPYGQSPHEDSRFQRV